MAYRTFKIGPTWAFGSGAVALLLILTVGTLASVAVRAESFSTLGPSDWAAISFTVRQALLSALLATLLAVPVARALARRNFPGRTLLIALFGAPFILPVIVAVLGLLAVFGRAGLVSNLLAHVGLGPLNIYGFHGVVLAHVFFNLPLATRLFLQGWQSISAEHFRLAAQLNMSNSETARHLERPMLRAIAPGAFATIFLLCTASFAVALALGGGPKATTVELAIYQAFRFDFDLSKAAILALVQFGLCGAAALLAWLAAAPAGFGSGLGRTVKRWDTDHPVSKLLDTTILTVVALFLILPLASIVLRGVGPLMHLPPEVFPATLRSVVVAVSSAFLTIFLAFFLAQFVIHLERQKSMASGWVESVGYLSIATSPMVIGTGLFILLFPVIDPVALALPITAIVNAAMGLPFALRALLPALRDTEVHFGRLAEGLGMSGWARFRLVTWPRIKQPIGFATGLSAALSMGDLGVIALFADPENATLPLLLYRLMSAYRMDTASGVALLLLITSFGLFWLFDRGGRLNADT